MGIPPELADVWRALVLHQKRWPEYQVSELVDAAILGMLEGLDDSSVFFLASEESYAEALESVAGSYAGIGASVIVEEDRILLFPGEDTQAEKGRLGARRRALGSGRGVGGGPDRSGSRR